MFQGQAIPACEAITSPEVISRFLTLIPVIMSPPSLSPAAVLPDSSSCAFTHHNPTRTTQPPQTAMREAASASANDDQRFWVKPQGLEGGGTSWSRTGVTVSAHHISYVVPPPTQRGRRRNQKKMRPKTLLRDVSMQVQPGELCYLMGPSGAGKTTLLEVLAGRLQVGTLRGDVLFNGQPRDGTYWRESSYLKQDDVHIAQLTVQETLRFAARLRMNGQLFSDAEREARVRMVADLLGLDVCLHSICGDAMNRGISGGQLKRLSIGVEIMNMPSLIFLDEPTSGLDSVIAHEGECVCVCVCFVCDFDSFSPFLPLLSINTNSLFHSSLPPPSLPSSLQSCPSSTSSPNNAARSSPPFTSPPPIPSLRPVVLSSHSLTCPSLPPSLPSSVSHVLRPQARPAKTHGPRNHPPALPRYLLLSQQRCPALWRPVVLLRTKSKSDRVLSNFEFSI